LNALARGTNEAFSGRYRAVEGEPETAGMGREESYDLVVPAKVGNW
jgi:hypothetical protein